MKITTIVIHSDNAPSDVRVRSEWMTEEDVVTFLNNTNDPSHTFATFFHGTLNDGSAVMGMLATFNKSEGRWTAFFPFKSIEEIAVAMYGPNLRLVH